MEYLDSRQNTFRSKRGKVAWPLQNSPPESFLSGNFLAKLGFYHSPVKGNPTRLTCFCCQEVCDWKEDYDHPIQYHLNNNPCDFVKMWGSVTGEQEWTKIATGNASFPEMKEYLLSTFQGTVPWPFGPDKGQKSPTFDKLATAGFCFQPMTTSIDHTLCPYCEVSLDGWDEDDDPTSEHKKRNPKCVFFKLVAKHLKESDSKSKAAPTEAKRKRGVKSEEDSLEAIKDSPVKKPKVTRPKRGNNARAAKGKKEEPPESPVEFSDPPTFKLIVEEETAGKVGSHHVRRGNDINIELPSTDENETTVSEPKPPSRPVRAPATKVKVTKTGTKKGNTRKKAPAKVRSPLKEVLTENQSQAKSSAPTEDTVDESETPESTDYASQSTDPIAPLVKLFNAEAPFVAEYNKEVEPIGIGVDESDHVHNDEPADWDLASVEDSEPKTLFERLEAQTKVPPEEIQRLYHENKDMILHDFLELLTATAIKRLDQVFQKEIDKVLQ